MHSKNNFDFLRLVLASFVIITHSYSLSGIIECDFLCQITNSQLSFSYIGVRGFFSISGYLIWQSLERSENLLEYYWKRILRLFPALFVALILTVLLCPFVYESNIPYLQNRTMWTYVPNNLLLYKMQYFIQGVFENNPYRGAINGSLRTIRYEFIMYVLVSFLFFQKKNKKATVIIILSVFSLFSIGNIFFLQQLAKHSNFTENLLDLGLFFIAGSVLAIIKIQGFNYKNSLILFSIAILLISLYFNFFDMVKFFSLPFAVILLGIKSTPIINNIGNKIGDLSYGVYIYGFPVQQTLEYYFGLDYLQLMLASLIISFFLAYISWHLIEYNALKLKRWSVVINFGKKNR